MITPEGGRTGLVVRASDSGSGEPGSILGRVGVLFPSARDIYSPKVLVIPRNRWLRLNMTEKLFIGTLNHNQNKTNDKAWCTRTNWLRNEFLLFGVINDKNLFPGILGSTGLNQSVHVNIIFSYEYHLDTQKVKTV